MTSTANATAAPLRITVGDFEYIVSPLRDKEWGELQRWAQHRHIDSRLELLEHAGITGEALDAKREAIAEEALSITTASGAFQEALSTIEGTMQYVYLALWRQHDAKSRDEFMALLGDDVILTELAAVTQDVDSEGVKKKQRLTKKRPKARRKKRK